MFPFDIEDDEVDVKAEEEKEPADYEIDFSTGKLTGRIVTGLDAIKQRVRLVLSTDRYYFPQYSWEHGSELTELIGKNYSRGYVKAEAKRMVEDALAPDDDIDGVEDFSCDIRGDTLTLSFTIVTIYGDEEVVIDV